MGTLSDSLRCDRWATTHVADAGRWAGAEREGKLQLLLNHLFEQGISCCWWRMSVRYISNLRYAIVA